MTLRDWYQFTDSFENTVSCCQALGLIPFKPSEPCNNGHNNWCIGTCGRAIDGCRWICKERSCRLTRSIRDGTFFSGSKLEMSQILDLMLFWSQGVDSHKFLRRHCGFASNSTIVDWKNFLCDVCAEHFLRNPAVIGGVGHIVEIDESSWTKRKYNRGRAIGNQWVFGGTDRDTGECFAVTVDRRDATTLLPIIQQYVRP
ncbi:unnamed protein product, partial [Didymodactylos carnosus]